MITQQEAIDQFKALIGAAPSWVRLKASQFIEHLAVFIHWCLEMALFAIERAKQEFFLSTALNDSSVMAHAEDREYVPRKRTPSSGTVRITNNGPNALSIPGNTALISDPQLNYLPDPVISIPSGGSTEISVSQLTYQTKDVVVDATKPFFEVLLSKEECVGLAAFRVYVDGEEWTACRMFRNATYASKVYDEFFTHTGQTGIRFGNGLFGAMPQMNAVITIEYWTTEGATSLLEGQQLHLLDDLYDDQFQPADITIETITSITGGGAEESIEEMRSNLHYWFLYNDKLVWDDDYSFFLKQHIANILWIKCWGEEQQEKETGFDVNNINRIFISAYAPGNPDLGTQALALLTSIPLLNRRFTWVDPLVSHFSIAVTGTVSKTTLANVATDAIRKLLTDNYGKDSTARKTEINYSGVYDLIKGTGYFEGAGANFQVTITGILTPTTLNEMVCLDPDPTSSPINLTVAK